jgi:hypothetical protein
LAGTLNEQLSPSALRPGLPAAKAALEALMQMTSNAAAAISINNLMARSSLEQRNIAASIVGYITKPALADAGESARYLHKNHACLAQTGPPTGFGHGARRVLFRSGLSDLK